MNKYLKWGLVTLIIAGVGVFGFYKLQPKQNEELAEAEKKQTGGNKKVLEVHARIIAPPDTCRRNSNCRPSCARRRGAAYI